MEILDTAHHEESFFPGDMERKRDRYSANGYMFVFSVIDRRSFQSIEDHYKEFTDYRIRFGLPITGVPCLLVGNKVDRRHYESLRQDDFVFEDEAKNLASKLGMEYIEVSATNLQETEACFHKLIQTIWKPNDIPKTEQIKKQTGVCLIQ